MGSCRATVSGSLLSRWQVSVVPERGSPVRITSFSNIVPPKVPLEEVVEPAVVRGELGGEAGARLGPHVTVGTGVVDLVLGRFPGRQPDEGERLSETLIRLSEKRFALQHQELLARKLSQPPLELVGIESASRVGRVPPLGGRPAIRATQPLRLRRKGIFKGQRLVALSHIHLVLGIGAIDRISQEDNQ